MTDDERSGMAWWNALTEKQRAYWLREAATAIVAEAWTAYKRTVIRDQGKTGDKAHE
jgi:hypothetical protein